jgi:hypothetical protein
VTLPATPFVCENIDEMVGRAIDAAWEHGYSIGDKEATAILAAALGQVIPAEVDLLSMLDGRLFSRFVTKFQPVVSTNQSHSESGLVVEPVVSDKEHL